MTTHRHGSGSLGRREGTRAARPPGLIASSVVSLVLLVLLIWQFSGVTHDPMQFQVLDPSLPRAWSVTLVGSVGVAALCSIVAWLRRRWVMPWAVANTVANGVGAVTTIVLTAEGRLFSETLPAQVAAIFGATTEWSELTELFLLLVAAVAVWDSLESMLRARRPTAEASPSAVVDLPEHAS